MSAIISVPTPATGSLRTARSRVEIEIEQLTFLGLRMAFGRFHSRPLLRQVARSCLERKLSFTKEWIAQGPFPKLHIRGTANLHRAASQRKGVVIAACHVGRYHRIPLVLNDLGFAVTLLLDEDNHAREQSEQDRWVARYSGPLDQPIEYVNAELPTAAWRMSRALRLERVLLVYMDGGTGLQNSQPAKTSVEVKFCGLPLLVRRGLAHVAACTGAPIVPAVCSETSQGRQSVTFYRPHLKREEETLDAYCASALQYCYSILEEQVVRDLASWEEWYHLHRWVIYADTQQTQTLSLPSGPEQSLKTQFLFDRDKVEILKLPTGPVLCHTRTGAAIKLNRTVVAALRAARRPTQGADLIAAIGPNSEPMQPLVLINELEVSGFLRRIS
jgi:lauroyl/myristoyl acyltransferase